MSTLPSESKGDLTYGQMREVTEERASSSDAPKAKEGNEYIYNGQKLEIRDVWADNLEEEMKVVREVVVNYNCVAMDTEFPGVVARPVGSFEETPDYQYQTLRCNVDLLKLIQLGLAFTNEKGELVPGCPCWQFHFKFSLQDDMYAQDSIDLLVRSGIDFEKHEKNGIDVQDFGEALISSGLVLMKGVKWISFHSGYDFGYLVKLLTCQPLPSDEDTFFELLSQYFPCIYDVKHLMTKVEGGKVFHGGLNRLAEQLGVDRVGPMHQAGSDSLLTALVFFELERSYFNSSCDTYVPGSIGTIHGLGKKGTEAGEWITSSNGTTFLG